MKQDQLGALSIGEPHAWHDRPPTIIEYRIDGLPSHLIAELANLGPDPNMQRWLFDVHGPKYFRSEDRYCSKEEAFTALKEWLRDNA